MAKALGELMKNGLNRLTRKRWARVADAAPDYDLEALRAARSRARSLKRQLDRVLQIADARLTLPYIGSNAIQAPLYSDWSYRPELWRERVAPQGRAAVESKTQLGSEATVYHDCRISELTFRQVRNTSEDDLAPFGLRMDVFRFDGSFLSLSLDLPPEAAIGLLKRHLVRFDCIVEMEKPLEIFARLNVSHGPNTEQLVRELPLHEQDIGVDFDLAYTKLNEKRVERIWIDLIFEGPEMNQIVLRDVTLSRRPRSEL